MRVAETKCKSRWTWDTLTPMKGGKEDEVDKKEEKEKETELRWRKKRIRKTNVDCRNEDEVDSREISEANIDEKEFCVLKTKENEEEDDI